VYARVERDRVLVFFDSVAHWDLTAGTRCISSIWSQTVLFTVLHCCDLCSTRTHYFCFLLSVYIFVCVSALHRFLVGLHRPMLSSLSNSLLCSVIFRRPGTGNIGTGVLLSAEFSSSNQTHLNKPINVFRITNATDRWVFFYQGLS